MSVFSTKVLAEITLIYEGFSCVFCRVTLFVPYLNSPKLDKVVNKQLVRSFSSLGNVRSGCINYSQLRWSCLVKRTHAQTCQMQVLTDRHKIWFSRSSEPFKCILLFYYYLFILRNLHSIYVNISSKLSISCTVFNHYQRDDFFFGHKF